MRIRRRIGALILPADQKRPRPRQKGAGHIHNVYVDIFSIPEQRGIAVWGMPMQWNVECN